MSRTTIHSLSIVLLGLLSGVFASGPGPERQEILSTNRKHLLIVTPHKNWPENVAKCKAELFRLDGRRRKKVWERYLINNVAPDDAFVTDSGDYVVTVGEYGEPAKLPVVIYDRWGELVHVHNLVSLGVGGAGPDREALVSGKRWTDDSLALFGPEDETFVVRLSSGKFLVIDLFDGCLVPDDSEMWKEIVDNRDKQIRGMVPAMLESEDRFTRRTGATIAGQLGMNGLLPALRKLLHDDATYSTRSGDGPWTKVFFVRKAAKKAIEALGEEPGKVVTELPEEPRDQ